HSNHAGDNQSWVCNAEPDADDRQQEEQVDKVGVGDRLQKLVEAAEIVSVDGGVSGLQRVGMAALDHLPPIEIVEEGVEVAALEVDHPQRDRLIRRGVMLCRTAFSTQSALC